MSSLRCTHKFNKRHKIVIAICTVAVLLLNIGPYTVFTAPKVEVEHSQCIELRKDPLCTQGGESIAYEVDEDGTSITKIKSYSTCAEYNANPKMIEKYGDVAWFCWGIFVLIEIVVLIVLVVGGIISAFKKLLKWLNEDEREEW